MYRIPFFVILSFCFVSCEKEITIRYPDIGNKIVVNAILKAGEKAEIYLSLSKKGLDENEFLIEDAVVVLFHNNVSDTLKYIGEGYYTSSETVIPETEYRLEVKSKKYGEVTSRTFIPKYPAGFSATDFTYGSKTGDEGQLYSEFTISIFNNPSKQNYYEIALGTFLSDDDIGEWDCYSDDYIVAEEGLSDYRWLMPTVVFSNRLINTDNYRIPFFFQANIFSWNFDVTAETDSLLLSFRNVSEEYYQFKKRLPVHLAGQDSDFWEGMGDPVPMYGNIDGGYGIFAGYAEASDTIRRIIN